MAADNGDTLSPVSQWAYPFPQTGTTGTVDPDAYLAAFQASDGPFPLGLNGLWHGGIHLDQAGASPSEGDSAMDRSGGVRCIADGVVVAYRLDSDYQHLTYPDNSKALYSRSFTLVKHKLTLPAAPANTSNPPNTPSNAPHPPTTAPANNEPNKLSQDPADSLVFFSLYMHLAPCKVYKHSEQDKNKKAWPSYYNAEAIYTVNDSRATDKQDHVVTGEAVKGSHVHRDSHNRAGESVGILRSGSKIKVQRSAHAPKNWGRIQSILSGEIVPLEPGKSVPPDAANGWVYLPWLDGEINPAALDSIYVLPKPVRISAGEVIGYLGEYQNAEHASTLPPSPQRALLHVEVFAGDDLQAFLARSRARAEQLTQEPKTQLVLSKGAHLYSYKTDGDLTLPANTAVTVANDAPHTGMWTKVQVKAAGSTNATHYWILRSDLKSPNARRAWNSFPLSLSGAPTGTNDYTRIVNVSGLTGHADDQKHTWYEVDAGDAGMNTVTGFVCASGQPNVSLQNKWAWAGFELLSSSLTTAEQYKRHLYLKGGSATDNEKAAFEASFNAAKSDTLIAKLDEIVTPKDQRQGRVSGHELLAALRQKWCANRIDHLVVKYESEWGGQMSKWDALDPFMHDGLPYWKAEKERIKLLQMWDPCVGALQPVSTPSVYHFHPVGIVGNFHCDGFQFTVAMLQHIFPSASSVTLQAVVAELNANIHLFKLDEPLRREHFLAQIRREAGASLAVHDGESLNYPPDRLRAKFSYFREHADESELYGRTSQHPADEQAIANRAYANRNGNGDIKSGDGWKYRGRGLIQITGRTQYQRFTEWHQRNSSGWPSEANLDFLVDYELVGEVKYAVRSAAAYWINNRMYETADHGATEGDVDNITRAINPGLFSHKPGHPISQENMNDIVDRRNNFASIHNWGGLK
ncbi:glycoside hydrolase family 19 protein [Trinickia diaoshuihuensis]|uniref:glycoside hydrolase family 19 protein n=1 Tax=Trinickia diaoshuihuensis TaxID=2292265 RepID=UPI0013C2DA47|nr:hypothetical protein [Trinickia diaoshuihuensis]